MQQGPKIYAKLLVKLETDRTLNYPLHSYIPCRTVANEAGPVLCTQKSDMRLAPR